MGHARPVLFPALDQGWCVGVWDRIMDAIADDDGLPMKLVITPGQTQDIQAAADLLRDIRKDQSASRPGSIAAPSRRALL